MAQRKKNILLLHLESISRANLWQYRNELGTVWRLMSGARQFSRFITASTSTTMSMEDIATGNSLAKDECTTYSSSRRTYVFVPPLAGIFWARGYKYLHFGSSQYSPIASNFLPQGGRMNNPDINLLCKTALEQFALAKRENKPFFAYFWDASSHLAYVSQYKEETDTLANKLRVAYSLVDASLNRLLSGMIELGIWDDTIIVGFGDHGDEAWSHDLNRGYCHSLPPYASVSWTPMFIWDPERFSPCVTDQLASSLDIKKTILGLADLEEPPPPKNSRLIADSSSIDLFKEKRDVAFSQNMFALQRERSDPEKGMIKGYAATNSEYRLVVSAGGGDLSQSGLELYHDYSDPSNSLNLLKFFKLDRHGDIVRFVPPPDIVGKHFLATFRQPAVESIIAAFSTLKPLLREYVEQKEKHALAMYTHILEDDMEELKEDLLSWRMFTYGADVRNDPAKRKNLLDIFEQGLKKVRREFAANQPELFPMNSFTQVRKYSR